MMHWHIILIYLKKRIMKTIKKISLILLIGLLSVSCAPTVKSNGNHGLPPGQVKKITGSKSARPYAPGQHKK